MCHYNLSLSIDATIMVSKNCPIIGEHIGTEFFQTLPKVASHPAYQNSVIRKKFTVPFLKNKRLKLKLRVFLAGHSRRGSRILKWGVNFCNVVETKPG